ncbi:hypothetical protein Tco_0014817 [Tanacetum coccineum]
MEKLHRKPRLALVFADLLVDLQQMYYAAFDAGNYFVMPGYPFGMCKLDNSTIVVEESMRVNMNIEACDFAIVITERCGSQWLSINKACPIATHPNAMKNSVTGEHKCMLLKPLATDDIEVIERSVKKGVSFVVLVAAPDQFDLHLPKDQFHHHLMLEAERRDLRNICENKSCIILVHSTSGYEGIRRSLGNRIIHDLFLTDNIHGYVESLAVTDGSSG